MAAFERVEDAAAAAPGLDRAVIAVDVVVVIEWDFAFLVRIAVVVVAVVAAAPRLDVGSFPW